MRIEAVSGAVQPSVQTARAGVKAGSFSTALKQAISKSGGQDLNGIFARAAQTYGVPENLLRAVAKAESGFRADAVSRCGAQGVMQLMPSTAKSLGVIDPLDPEQNIMGGAKYLGSLLSRYGGDAKLALAAYNAGSGSVARYGGVPPFPETQNYVKRVLSYAGGNLSVPDSAGTSCGAETGGVASGSAVIGDTLAPLAVSFTREDYGKFLELFAQQIAERALSLPIGGEREMQSPFLI